MFLGKQIFFTFLILYEIPSLINTQEYLKDLKPKDIQFNSQDELPPVELPRPFEKQRSGKILSDEEEEDDDTTEHLEKSERPSIMDIALEISVREGLNAMRKLYAEVEPDMVKNGQVLPDNHPAAMLSRFSAPVVESSRREMAAYAALTAAKVFRQNYDLNGDLARQAHSQKVSLRRTALESLCPPRDPPVCMPASERYRTHDGTCNNKKRLRWGAAQMPFNRFLPPEYGDGVDTTRQAVDGGPLSSSRFVSLLVHGARDGDAPLTLMLAQWGQLLDHDLTSTAQPRSFNGSVPSCCGSTDFHPSCFPIKVPLDDPWLSPLKVRCLEFLRSAPAQRRDCVLSWREQTNQATSYIDASPIYSSSVKSSDNARVFRKGLLIFGRGNPAEDVCQRGAIATHCIRSGDGRSGEQPGLLALHQVWVHEHNYIAMKLGEMNLHWSDEKIYQETRRIIGAMFQHITYREFLPIVLGREVLKLFDLELMSSGYYEGYDPKTNPTVANAFSAAAFRFGHSLIQNSYMRCDRFHNVMHNNVSLHEEFQRGDIGSVGSLHRLIRGLASQKILKRDEFITPELTNHLFQTPGFPFGLDLAAINIQRGRDHGIAPYTHWRVPCGLTPINTWKDFANVVGPESARRISHAYHSVHDIDLFVGGIAERPVVGGLVGPTFACIIAQQFSNSRKGDRFWYENPGFESSFTPAQLHVIRRVSLASVLCRAVGGGTFQPHIFLPSDFESNERLPCGVPPLGDFDISPWMEEDPFEALGITHNQEHQPSRPFPRPQPTFAPQTSTTIKPQPPTKPDRIFDIMNLEIKSHENSDRPLGDNKVGFVNRNPVQSIKEKPIQQQVQKPNVDFIPNPSSGFLTVKNNTHRINDKLDIRKKGTQVHVTKQKPVSGVNSKLDKKNRNRPGGQQNTTRRTIIVNNIPIELRSAGRNNAKKGQTKTEKPEARTENPKDLIDLSRTESNEEKGDELKLEARTEDIEDGLKDSGNDVEESGFNDKDLEMEIKKKVDTTESNITVNTKIMDIPETINENPIEKELGTTDNTNNSKTSNDKDEETNRKDETDQTVKSNNTNTVKLDLLKTSADLEKVQSPNKIPTNDRKDSLHSTETQTHSSVTEVIQKIFFITKNLQNSEQNNFSESRDIGTELYDSDIDPMAQTTAVEHKRVQRRLVSPEITEKLKDKLRQTTASVFSRAPNSGTNPTMTTKSPKLERTTLRSIELRQYHNRPSYTKKPQKVIVDTVNGDNQYEIEINIRQTNKKPKPIHSTAQSVDYTNSYNPNRYDRYTPNYQTTPGFPYYQPEPTVGTNLAQNQRTKPPTIIYVNEHEAHLSTKPPGFLQSIVGWSSNTQRPLPESIGFSRRPGSETIIGSPHSTAHVQPVYQQVKPPTHLALPAGTSSYSQAQVGTQGVIQASSASVSSGNFGTIAGFHSANGADSTFSFNIRPKPDKSQNNKHGGNYGLSHSSQNPWYNQQNPEYVNLPIQAQQQIQNYEIPYRENVQSPFSSFNSQNYYKKGVQRKEALILNQDQELEDYDYAGRTLQPLRNISLNEHEDSSEEKDMDYEYDEDYGSSALLRKFNQDGYMRPEHMISSLLKSTQDSGNETMPTKATNQTLDDNYVLPVLNNTKDMPKDLPKPLNTNFSTDFPDSQGKHLNNDIFAEDSGNNERNSDSKTIDKTKISIEILAKTNRKRNKVKIRNQEKIAFAPLNVLTKPERPDNWVFFESPKEAEPMLPQQPVIEMDLVPSAEIPKPFKENFWLDLAKIKLKYALQFQKTSGHLQTVNSTELKPDNINTKDETSTEIDSIKNDNLEESLTKVALMDPDNNKENLTNHEILDLGDKSTNLFNTLDQQTKTNTDT